MPKKTLFLTVFSLSMLFFLFFSFASQAKEAVFYPQRIKNIHSEEEATSYILIKFDLSPIPHTAIIHSAFLYLHTNETAKEYRLHRVDESWININTIKPTKKSRFLSGVKAPSSARGGYISWSVREDVVLWVLKKVPNYGWCISILDSYGNFFLRTFDIKLVVRYSTIDVTVVSGEDIVLNVDFSPEDIQRGFCYFSAKTLLKVICNTNWQIIAIITPISWPEERSNAPIPNAFEVKCGESDWAAGGGVIKTGSATGMEGEIITVLYRFNLTCFREIPSKSTFVFRITFTAKQL